MEMRMPALPLRALVRAPREPHVGACGAEPVDGGMEYARRAPVLARRALVLTLREPLLHAMQVDGSRGMSDAPADNSRPGGEYRRAKGAKYRPSICKDGGAWGEIRRDGGNVTRWSWQIGA